MNNAVNRRRLLGKEIYEQTAYGNPILVRSMARMRPPLTVYGHSTQDGTPSPENPVPIVSAGSVMVESKNLCNMPDVDEYVMKGVTYSCKNGAVTANGTATDGESVTISRISYDLPITAGTYYVSGSSDVLAVYVRVTKSDGSQGYYSSSIFTLDGTETRCVVYVRVAEGATANNVTVYPMINTGSTALPYEPYFTPYADPDEGEINVTMQGGNLFDKSTAIKNKYISDTTGEMNDRTMGGDTTASDYVLVEGLSYIRVTDTTFARWMAFYDINKDFISGVNGYIDPIQVPQNAEYVRFTIPSSVVDTFVINPGEALLPYESYKQPQTLTIPTPGGLPGIPVSSGGNYTDENGQQWICDEVDFKRGKYVQRVKQATLDGSEDEEWYAYDDPTYLGFYSRIADMEEAGFNSGYCDLFPVEDRVFGTEPGIWLGSTWAPKPSNKMYIHNSNPNYATNVDEWRAWLRSNPMTILYPLATPIETDLPAEEIAAYKALHTYSPATTVSNDAGAWMKLGYKTKKSLQLV